LKTNGASKNALYYASPGDPEDQFSMGTIEFNSNTLRRRRRRRIKFIKIN
jgi:hypothetical protein